MQAAHDDWLLPAASLIAFILWDLVRIWLPSILFIAGDAGSTSAITMGSVALATASAPFMLAIVVGDRFQRSHWIIAISTLIGSRLALQLVTGGAPQFLLSTLGVLAGVAAIAMVAGSARLGAHARLAVLLGIAASSAVHAAFGGIDLLWRDGVGPAAAAVVLCVALAFAAHRAMDDIAPLDVTVSGGSALAWWILGPVALLIGIQLAPTGRIATATNWSDPMVTFAVTIMLGLVVVSADMARRLPPRPTAAVAVVAVIVGTLGSLRAENVMAVVAQLILAGGLGCAMGVLSFHASSSTRWRAASGAGVLVGLVGLGFAYYAPYDIATFYSPRTVTLIAAVIIAAACVFTTLPADAPVTRQRLDAGRSLTLASAVAITALLAAGLTPRAAPVDVETNRPSDQVRVAFINMHMGFDMSGRLSISRLAEELQTLAPDVVVLNEVDRGWLTTGSRDTLRILERALGYDAIFAPAADDIWGNALLSAIPITEAATDRLPQGADAMTRSQLSVVLDHEVLGRIAIVGTHLSHTNDRGATRVAQARAVAATVARHGARSIPTIVAGDLNAPLGSVEVQAFGDFVASAFPEGMATWPADDPEVQIDHILVSPRWTVIDATHFGHGTSDHLGLVVDLALEHG